MQKMILVPVDQYNRMVDSYYEAREELVEVSESLKSVKHLRENPWRIDRVLRLLMEMDDEALDCVYYVSLGVLGKAV